MAIRYRATAALAVCGLLLVGGCAGPTAPSGPVPLGPGVVPEAGQVGYIGDPAKLTLIDGPQNAPQGTQWVTGVLQIAQSDVVLDKVHVAGPIEYTGSGTLTVRNSIVDGTAAAYSVITGRSGHLDISDTTVRWTGESPGERWGNGAIQGDSTMTVVRCDVSGAPDGIQNGPGNSTFEQNYIHDLAVFGTYPQNTHNDGIQNYGGSALAIRNNRIDISTADGKAYDGEHQNAAIFVTPSPTTPSDGLQIVGNYLEGGGYTVRLGAPLHDAEVVGNRFGPTAGGWGSILVDDVKGIQRWADNTDSAGSSMVQP